ncbi:DUF2345 domain-containing protein, partial [Yersinia pseudotuberculosis]
FIGVGNTLSIFVRKLGMKLIANQGPITVQAQNDLMELLARKAITITSTEDEIKITAKKKITLNAGGSYITLDENRIESGTAGEYLTKAGYYGRQEKAKQVVAMPEFQLIPGGKHNLQFLFTDDDNVPYSNTPYIAYLVDGREIKGVTDAKGNTEKFVTDEEQNIKINLQV